MTPFESVEGGVVGAVQWLRLAVESVGAVIVACGVIVSSARVIKVLTARPPRQFNDVRIAFARYLALALEFQLGADILDGDRALLGSDRQARRRRRDSNGAQLLPDARDAR